MFFLKAAHVRPNWRKCSQLVKSDIDGLQRELVAASGSEGVPGARPEQLSQWTDMAQSIQVRLRQAESFAACLQAQDVKDSAAAALNGRVQSLGADYTIALTRFDDLISRTPDSIWEGWVQKSPVKFYLNERRQNAKEKLSPELGGIGR